MAGLSIFPVDLAHSRLWWKEVAVLEIVDIEARPVPVFSDLPNCHSLLIVGCRNISKQRQHLFWVMFQFSVVLHLIISFILMTILCSGFFY